MEYGGDEEREKPGRGPDLKAGHVCCLLRSGKPGKQRIFGHTLTCSSSHCICAYSLGVQALNRSPRLSLPGSVPSLAGCNQVLGGLRSHKEVRLGRVSPEQNASPCICKSEGPSFLLAVIWRLPSAPRAPLPNSPPFHAVLCHLCFSARPLTSSSYQGGS